MDEAKLRKKLAKYGKIYFGKNPILQEKDIFRFEATLKNFEQVTEQVTEQVLTVIRIIQQEVLTSSELMRKLRLKHRPTFLYNYLQPAIEFGLIERTIPEKPNSRLQKYRLTEKGKKYLESKKNV